MPLLFLRVFWRLVSGFRHYLYAVLAGHGADGGLMGHFRDVQCGLSTGGRQEWWQVRPLL